MAAAAIGVTMVAGSALAKRARRQRDRALELLAMTGLGGAGSRWPDPRKAGGQEDAMATLAERNEFVRRSHELEVETRLDKTLFAVWVIAILFAIVWSLVLGLATSGY